VTSRTNRPAPKHGLQVRAIPRKGDSKAGSDALADAFIHLALDHRREREGKPAPTEEDHKRLAAFLRLNRANAEAAETEKPAKPKRRSKARLVQPTVDAVPTASARIKRSLLQRLRDGIAAATD
jgi:hypothetical protein